jgi:hypothetical protein
MRNKGNVKSRCRRFESHSISTFVLVLFYNNANLGGVNLVSLNLLALDLFVSPIIKMYTSLSLAK